MKICTEEKFNLLLNGLNNGMKNKWNEKEDCLREEKERRGRQQEKKEEVRE